MLFKTLALSFCCFSASLINTANVHTVNQTEAVRLLKDDLFKAVVRDSAEDIKKLVQAGADVNQAYYFGQADTQKRSILILAVQFQRYNAIKALLELKADITPDFFNDNVLGCIQDKKKIWPLFRSIPNIKIHVKNILSSLLISNMSEDECIEVVKDCLKIGCDINDIWSHFLSNIQPTCNHPCTDSTSPQSKFKLLKFFLRYGANPNLAVNRGMDTCTPLILFGLCFFSHGWGRQQEEALELLLSYGADINAKVYGLSVGDVSILTYLINRSMNADLITFFINHGATL